MLTVPHRIAVLALTTGALVAGTAATTPYVVADSPDARVSAPSAHPRHGESAADRSHIHGHPGSVLARPAGHSHPGHGASISRRARATAQLATAAFQDEEMADAAGWKSSLKSLGCFQDPDRGGMGVHYINEALLDDRLDIARPEALVYELDADGAVTGLVAHEYIVPVDRWTKSYPPRLFGVALHRHPSLPLYVLHAWLWKDNARGDFDDWNPAVRQCPPGVPVFGQSRPRPTG